MSVSMSIIYNAYCILYIIQIGKFVNKIKIKYQIKLFT